MKYSNQIIINKPRHEVIQIFNNEANLYKWQNGLKSIKIISGEKGKVGLTRSMIYEMNGKDTEMIEIVESIDLPYQITLVYKAKGIWNRCVNKFSEIDQKTLWQVETEFKMSGFMKTLEFFGKKILMSQTESDMNRFKTFAEAH